jgi:hypothetical protein
VQRRLLLDVVVGERAAVLQLLAREDQALLVGRDALLVLDFLLHVLDGVAVWKEEKGRAMGGWPASRTRRNEEDPQKEEKNTRSPRFDVERDGFAREGLDEDLHARHAGRDWAVCVTFCMWWVWDRVRDHVVYG